MKKTTSISSGPSSTKSKQQKKSKTPAQKGIALYGDYVQSERSQDSLKALKAFKDEGGYSFNKIGLGHVADELTEAFSKMNTTKTSVGDTGHRGAYI